MQIYFKPEAEQTQATRNHERLVRMTQVVESFASGFTMRPIKVRLVPKGVAPAYSTSSRIWFSEANLPDVISREGAVSVKGLTLHEIAHIMLTPRSGSDLVVWVKENKLFDAFNALEDQRIESQLLALYPSIKDWLIAMIGQHLLGTPEQWQVAYPLVHGRKYLDRKVRKALKTMYVNQDDLPEIVRVIDRYRVLNLSNPDHAEEAKELIETFAKFIQNLQGRSCQPPSGSGEEGGEQGGEDSGEQDGEEGSDGTGDGTGGCGLGGDIYKHGDRHGEQWETNAQSPTISKGQQKTASDRLQDEDEDDLDDYTGFDSDDIEEDNDGSEPSDSGDAGDEPDTDSGDDGTGSGNADDVPDAPAGNDAPSTIGGNGDAEENLTEILQNSIEQVMERLGDKIDNDIDLYNGEAFLEGEPVPDPDRASYYPSQVTPDVASASLQFAEELKRIRAEHDPAWRNRVESGRINPFRWEQEQEDEQAFDRFETGRADATDIEAVVLLDTSGSMSGDAMTHANNAMWAIKTALDSIDADTSVITYNSAYSSPRNSCKILYSSDEKASGEIRSTGASGGTDPSYALKYAEWLLSQSTRAIKLLIVITDGYWADESKDSSRETIANLNKYGVLTSFGWIGHLPEKLEVMDTYGVQVVSHLTSAKDLVHLAEAIVNVGIERKLGH